MEIQLAWLRRNSVTDGFFQDIGEEFVHDLKKKFKVENEEHLEGIIEGEPEQEPIESENESNEEEKVKKSNSSESSPRQNKSK